MKKRFLSLFLCVCLCAALLPAVCMTAFAGVGFDVYVGSTYCGSGTTVLPSGQGTVTVGCIGSTVTVTLDNCNIGTAKEYSFAADTYSCGLLFVGDEGEPADVKVVLNGENDIIPCIVAVNASSLTFTSIDDGSLTVHNSIVAYCPVVLDKTDLTVTAEQSMQDNALSCDSLTVDQPTKGGGSLSCSTLTVDTDRPIGVSADAMTIHGGIVDIRAARLGILLMPGGRTAPPFTVNGGVSTVSGGVAAAYFCASGRNLSNVTLAEKITDVYGNELTSSKPDNSGFCKQSWIPANESGLYFRNSKGEDGFWYEEDLTSNAAKSICLKESPYAYVTFDCGAYGTVAGEQSWVRAYEFGSRIGALPVPTNTTFTDGNFNGMYFDGWALKDQPGDLIDEACILNGDLELEAVWLEGQGMMHFQDVKDGQWFYDAVKYCNGQGLMAGTDANHFSPTVNCSRAMIVTILYRMEGTPAVYAENKFSDVKSGQWYTDAVLWASENGIVAGDGKGHFMPNADVTREQLAAIMRTYADYTAMYRDDTCAPLTGFSDSGKISSWAADAVSWAFGFGILSGKGQPDGSLLLDPLGKASRAEFAAILMSYIRRTQNATVFYGDLIEVPVPMEWQGNVICRKTRGEGCELSFYCKQEYELGEGGRLCGIVVTNSGDYLHDPAFDTYLCMIMNSEYIKMYNVYRQKITDVQCTEPESSARGARYYSMLGAVQDLGYDLSSIDWYYTVSYGVG